MAEPTILARLVEPLLAACRKQQGGAALALSLAEEFGLEPVAPGSRDPEQRLPLSRFYDLLERAAERSGDELLGVHYSLGLDPAAFEILGFLALTSPNLGTAMDRMFRYQALMVEGEDGSMDRANGRVTIRVENWGPPRPAHRLWNEAAMVDMIVNGRQMLQNDFAVHEVRLRHEAHGGAEQLAALLAAPVRFGAEDNAVVLPESVLALPIPGADPAMFAYFDREAARRVAEQAPAPTPSSTRERVRERVRARLPEGVPAIEELAEQLHLSPRTLQRRLQDEGESLRGLVDDLRHELALQHLARGVSIAEISFLLGFSEPSAFHRAFRRWTKRTPAQWREERREERASPQP